MKRPRLSPALFALICISFAFPFATVSCDNAKTSFTGVQLVTFTVPAGGTLDTDECRGDISGCIERHGAPPAMLALLMALGGLILGLRGREKGPGWLATGGMLAMLWIAFDGAASMVTIDFRIGYVLIVLLFLAAMCVHGVKALRRRRWKAEPEPQAIV
jgi:hypothetical protein